MNLIDEWIAETKSNANRRRYETAFTRPIFKKPAGEPAASQQRACSHVMTVVGVLLLLTITLFPVAHAQQGVSQDFGSGGLFSYVPPDGWKVVEFPGLKYKICLGEPVKGFAPNIVVTDEAYEKSLDDYVKDNVAAMQQIFQGQKILSQTDFTISGGARAVKMVTERHDPQSNKNIRQTYYFIELGNKKLVVTCSNIAEDGGALDQVFEAAMKTFTVTKDPA